MDVHVHKCRHQELTVKPEYEIIDLYFLTSFLIPVHNTTMSWYDISKILDLEGPLEA